METIKRSLLNLRNRITSNRVAAFFRRGGTTAGASTGGSGKKGG